MKAFRNLIAAAALCAAGIAPALANTSFTNGSFNDGLNGWQSIGDVSVQTYQGTNKRAVLTTAYLDDEDGPHNLSGTPAEWIDAVAAFAGIAPDALDRVPYVDAAVEGSAMKQTFSVLAGDRLTLDFDFGLVTSETDIFNFNDMAFVAINGAIVKTISLTDTVRTGQFSFDFIASGMATVAFGVLDFRDVVGVSEFRVDNISISAVPEPETIAMLLAGLGVIGAAARRRKAAQAEAA